MGHPVGVKIRPRKACRYPNLRPFGWVSYDKVGGLYSGKLGNRSEARASDLRSFPGLWWKRIKLYLYEGTKVSTLRGPAQLADLQGALFVVCGCSIRVRGYMAVSYILGFRIMCRGIIRYMPRSVELPPRGAVDDVNGTTRALMITILPVYM